MTVTLLARKNPESDWQMVQTWPGQQLTLTNHVGTAVFDLDSLHNGVLRQMASYKGWEAKVIVDAGKDIVVQKTFQAFDSASR